jgi:hypothetical protein
MTGGTAWRVAGVAIGTATAAYGVPLLVGRQDPAEVTAALTWLVAGVLLHDAVLAPLTIVVGVVAARWRSAHLRVAGMIALVVLGPLTLLAVPVLGGFGEEPTNPSLLDRPYVAGWALIVALTCLAAAGHALVVRSRHGARKETDGPGAGRG